jgi:site-specific DNA recombinase
MTSRRNHVKSKEPIQQLRVAGYIRVSSARQVEEGDSLIAQQNQIENEIKNREVRDNWKVGKAELYIDKGKSAKNQNRPDLQRLKRDIAAGCVDVVICFKLDRLTRSLSDFIELWQLFEDHNVNVISLRENFDTTTPTGRAMLKLIMVFAELEREMTAERTFATMRDRTERGLWNGGHVLGYLSDPNEPGRLIMDPDWAPKIKQYFFDAFEELGSSTAVLKQLDKLGLKTPVRKSRAGKIRGGQPFTKNKILDILRNPIYTGRIQWGEAFRENCHEPIISSEQFKRVGARVGETRRHRRNHRYSRGRSYLLRGLVRCSCGSHMTPQGAQGRSSTYHYYVCTKQLTEASAASCAAPRIPAEALEAAVLDRLRQLGDLEAARERIVHETAALLDDEGRRLAEEEAIARRERNKVQSEINRLVECLKTLPLEKLASVPKELRNLEAQAKSLTKVIQDLCSRQQPIQRISEQAKKFLETWRDVGQVLDEASPDEKRLIIQHFVEVVELTATSPKGDTGTYALKLFPEANPGLADVNKQNGNEPEQPEICSVLTEDSSVLQLVEKAPPVGLEQSLRVLLKDFGCGEFVT